MDNVDQKVIRSIKPEIFSTICHGLSTNNIRQYLYTKEHQLSYHIHCKMKGTFNQLFWERDLLTGEDAGF